MTMERFRASLWAVRRHPHCPWLPGAFISSAASKLPRFIALIHDARAGQRPPRRRFDLLDLWLLGADDMPVTRTVRSSLQSRLGRVRSDSVPNWNAADIYLETVHEDHIWRLASAS